MLDTVVRAVVEPSPRGIAEAISGLIYAGSMADGDRLPTVRQLGSALGISPATVSQAWQALAGVGLIESRGRSGSFVRRANATWMPPRMSDLAGSHTAASLDLSTGTPDPLLLPSLETAYRSLPERATTESYLTAPVLPELEAVLRASWPVQPAALTVMNGALDGVVRVLEVVARFGDRVVVEEPGFPGFLDVLDQWGLTRVPVERDEVGMIPARLSAALDASPAAILLQPRTHNPSGTSMTADRAAELARVIRRKEHLGNPIVIEDDHSGQISTAPDVSLARWLPNSTVHVRGFSKSHGPDLRISAVGGPAAIMDRVMSRRLLGPSWTSRLLQRLLSVLLSDPRSIDEVAEARRQYHGRQHALAAALGRAGLQHRPGDGINTWLPVRDERAAVLALAGHGIRVAGGAPFFAAPDPEQQFVRISLGALSSGFDELAPRLRDAARA